MRMQGPKCWKQQHTIICLHQSREKSSTCFQWRDPCILSVFGATTLSRLNISRKRFGGKLSFALAEEIAEYQYGTLLAFTCWWLPIQGWRGMKVCKWAAAVCTRPREGGGSWECGCFAVAFPGYVQAAFAFQHLCCCCCCCCLCCGCCPFLMVAEWHFWLLNVGSIRWIALSLWLTVACLKLASRVIFLHFFLSLWPFRVQLEAEEWKSSRCHASLEGLHYLGWWKEHQYWTFRMAGKCILTFARWQCLQWWFLQGNWTLVTPIVLVVRCVHSHCGPAEPLSLDHKHRRTWKGESGGFVSAGRSSGLTIGDFVQNKNLTQVSLLSLW